MVVKVPADRLRPAEHQPAPQPRRPRPSASPSSVSKPHIKSKYFSHDERPATHDAPPLPPLREAAPPPVHDVPAPQAPAERSQPPATDTDRPARANGSHELKMLKELLDELDMGGDDES
jgi:hypothetical protein